MDKTNALKLIANDVANEFSHSLGIAPDHMDIKVPFVEWGADSLILSEILQNINRRYKVNLPIVEVYERLNSAELLSRYLYEHGASQSSQVDSEQTIGQPQLPERTEKVTKSASANAGLIETTIMLQLELMEQQLGLLKQNNNGAIALEDPKQTNIAEEPSIESIGSLSIKSQQPLTTERPDRFSAFSIDLAEANNPAEQSRKEHVEQLAEEFNAKTPKSKDNAQAYRKVLSDNRVSAGFRPLLKEIVYPLLADRGQGARLIDIDGNEFVDFTMGFGAHLFGHSPKFITEAVRKQLDVGMPIGPQSPLAGEVASLIAEMTGHSRVVFCNTGGEATMTALRLARARTVKDKVVIFKNSYHGTFDGFLARADHRSEGSVPASMGIPVSMVEDTIVLDYGEDSALEYIEANYAQIAAVMVEPVQSRMPNLQPKAFLEKLQAITSNNDISLIFDEVICGFRCAPGGAQELFGVRADMSIYGKVVGGGMPIGVVAGSDEYLDCMDGGWWQYGDGSYPSVSTIFFAGTFSKHPLTMAASLATLKHLKKAGPELHQSLNKKTAKLVERLNAVFEQEGVAIRTEYCTSFFRFSSSANLDLFFYHLLNSGVYIWEGRNCFVSTSHTASDLDKLVDVVRSVTKLLGQQGLLPVKQDSLSQSLQKLPVSEAQKRFSRLEIQPNGGSVACNLCFGFQFDIAPDTGRLVNSVEAACLGESTLHNFFDLENSNQKVADQPEFKVQLNEVNEALSSELLEQHLLSEQAIPLSVLDGENIRINLYIYSCGGALMIINVHHLVCDGWGLTYLLNRIAGFYNTPEKINHESPATSYKLWLEHESRYFNGKKYQSDKAYWLGRLQQIYQRRHANRSCQIHNNPTIGPRPGGRARSSIKPSISRRYLDRAKSIGATPFTALLSSFQVFLCLMYPEKPPMIGVPFANRTSESQSIVGNCVNLLPFLPTHASPLEFDTAVQYTKSEMGDFFDHSGFPYAAICEMYEEISDSAFETPIDVTFNVEPIDEMPSFGSLKPKLLMAENAYIEFDLMFNVFVLSDEIHIELDYDKDKFTQGEMCGRLNLLSKIIENSCV